MLKVKLVFLLSREEGTGNPGGTASILSDCGCGGCVGCSLTQCRSLGNIRRSGLMACLAWDLLTDLSSGPSEPVIWTLADQPEMSPVI